MRIKHIWTHRHKYILLPWLRRSCLSLDFLPSPATVASASVSETVRIVSSLKHYYAPPAPVPFPYSPLSYLTLLSFPRLLFPPLLFMLLLLSPEKQSNLISYSNCCGAGPILTGSGSGSDSSPFPCEPRQKSSNLRLAFPSLHWLRLP